VVNPAARDRRLLQLEYEAHAIEYIPCLSTGGQREQMDITEE
jgi:hypothetical protein